MIDAKTIEQKIARFSIAELISLYEHTEKLEITNELAVVRGWLMNELEARNPEAFDAWLESGIEYHNGRAQWPPLNQFFN